jgi:catechol 2,3-dioxygenase-like lactoylglutathione lyase family enzyme
VTSSPDREVFRDSRALHLSLFIFHFCLLVAAAFLGAPLAAQPGAMTVPAFHHLHLNSINPDAAIAFYTRHFPSTSRTTFAGLPALQSPTDVLILFTKVDTPPATQPPTALWHFGWHVADVHQSIERLRRAGVTLLPLYTGDAGGTVFTSADTWPGSGGVLGLTKSGIADAKARGVTPTRGAGFAYLRGPTMRSSSTRATCRASASITFTCTRSSRSAPSSGTARI